MNCNRFFFLAFLFCSSWSINAQVNDTLAKYINKRLAGFHSFDAVIVTEHQMSALTIYESGVKANTDKRFEEAINTLWKAVDIDSSGNCGSGMNGAAFNELGYAYTRLFKKDSALLCLDRSIQFNPNHPKAYINKVFLLVNLKQREQALSTLDELSRRIPDFNAAKPLRGWLLQQTGKGPEARQEYQKALQAMQAADEDAEGRSLRIWLTRMISELPDK